MPTRNLRPRVLTAVHTLGAFTVSELCRAARLTDRSQAYTQLDRLKKLGYIEEQTLPATAAHAPFKEYRLVSDPVQRRKFAEELAGYQAPQPEPEESELAQLALSDASQSLDKIEKSLAEGAEPPEALDADFDSAWTNIETARLESTAPGPQSNAAALAERWQKADTKRAERKAAAAAQPVRLNWAPMLRTIARAVSAAAVSPLDLDRIRIPGARNLAGRYRAPAEALLDEIRAGRERPFSPVLRQALRTGDAKVVYEILEILKDIDAAWWKYNCENTAYLKTSNLRAKEWLAAYEALRKGMPFERGLPFRVYSYAPERLTRNAYLTAAEGQCVSLVSPCEIGFLGVPEPVKPTLLIESGSTLKPLECEFLKPEDSLYAYGPIAGDISCWQGAPGLRVAACLGMWGLPLKGRLREIAKSLERERGLLIAQSAKPHLAPEIAAGLAAEEIGECLAK